jgi:hypothetical protein
MQEFINRTGNIAENMYSAALDAAHLATYFGFSYIALSVLTSFVRNLSPVRECDGHN